MKSSNEALRKREAHYSGDIIIRLTKNYACQPGDDLSEFCKKNKLSGLFGNDNLNA